MADTPSSIILQNARVVTPNGILNDAYIHVHQGVIVAIGNINEDVPRGVTLIDVHGQWVVPGFIDMHVHGGGGADVMDGTASSIRTIGRFHAEHGTTSWLPTTLTAPVSDLTRALQAVHAVQTEELKHASQPWLAGIVGLHLEGPFIAESRRGAQNPEFILPPSVDIMRQISAAAPSLIRKVTIAPEIDGAIPVIRWLTSKGILSSMGHTDATLADIFSGVRAGATHATHICNGMRGLHHREGGAVGGCLLSEGVVCELIADGHHVDVDVMKLIVKTKGIDKIVLITDAMAAAGQPDGAYRLGGLDVTVENGVALLTEGHNLAGSTLTMDVAVKNMVNQVGVDIVDAIQMAATTPARELRIDGTKGAIEPGKDADLVILNENFSTLRTFVRGYEVYRS